MKKFDEVKVREVAIDLPNRQQLYVHDHRHRVMVIETLKKMGFRSDKASLSKQYRHLPLVINVNEKRFFTVGSASVMACAVQSGAKILDFKALNKLVKLTV